MRRAAQKVPYYARIFRENGWDPLQAEKYWDRWPILTQQALQEHREELIATDVTKDRLYTDVSGGSSGHTKKFYHSCEYSDSTNKAAAYSNSIAGWTPGCRVAQLWGGPTDITAASSALAKFRSILACRRLYDCYDISQDRMARYHLELSRYQPEVMIAYAGAVFQLSRFLKVNNLTPAYPSKSIITSAETLAEDMRSQIRQVFKKPIFDRYGSREVGLMAFECDAHRGLHIAFTHSLLEVVKPGTLETVCEQEGDILVTTLAEPSFPLIRYQIGDVAVATEQQCTCGRNGPKLGKVVGRSNDFITKADGGRIHGLRFTPVFWRLDKVRQFLVIQQAIDRIEIQLVLSEPLTGGEKARIISEFHSQVGDNVRLEVKKVDRITPLPSGKKAFVISDL